MLTPSSSLTSEHTLHITVQRKFGGFYYTNKPVTLVVGETRLTAETDRWGVAIFRFVPTDEPLWVEVDGSRQPVRLSWKSETKLRFLI